MTYDHPALKDLGKRSDGDIAREMGVAQSTISNLRLKRGIPIFKPPLKPWQAAAGTDTDTAIAERFGIDFQTVMRYRGRAGIPAFRWREAVAPKPARVLKDAPAPVVEVPKRSPPPPRPIEPLPPEVRALLGKVPDRQIIREHGIGEKRLRNARERAGIASFRVADVPRRAEGPTVRQILARREEEPVGPVRVEMVTANPAPFRLLACGVCVSYKDPGKRNCWCGAIVAGRLVEAA